MKTLKEVVDFVGIPQGSLASARYQYSGPWTMGLHNVNLLVTGGARPASMRNTIEILQNLTPITLEAEIVGSRSGEEPFNLKIRVNASGGITWFTTIEDGNVVSRDVNNSGGDFTIPLGPGSYQLAVTRAGISNTGFVSLRRPLGTISVSTRLPPPSPPPLPPLPQAKPFIDVRSNGDGSFVVSGENFLGNTTVHIRVVDAALTTLWFEQTSNPAGKIEYPTGRICQLPGQLFFSANDGRSDPQDLTGTLWSNTATSTCPPSS